MPSLGICGPDSLLRDTMTISHYLSVHASFYRVDRVFGSINIRLTVLPISACKQQM